MPVLGTMGAMSARGFGVFGVGIPQSYWIGVLDGTSSSEEGRATTIDSSGNVYMCGYSNVNGNRYIQLAKYNSSGVIQWQRSLGNSFDSEGSAIAVDSSSNVYICGYATQSGNPIIQIAKYNSSGVIQWQRSLRGSVQDKGFGIVVDTSANVYICGFAYISGSNGMQIAKYNTSGVIQWQRRLHPSGLTSNAYSIAIDSSSNIYIAGQRNLNGVDFSIQIAKYDSSGVIQWQRSLGNSGFQTANGIAVDSSSNVYICGYNSNNGNDVQIAKYNTSGVIQWQRSLSGPGGYSIATDSSSNVYIAYGIGQIAKYNTSGVIQWQRQLRGQFGATYIFSIATDGSGNVHTCGYWEPTTRQLWFTKVPNDGSKTNFYTVAGYFMYYEAGSFVDAATTLTDSASSLTDSATTLTDSASTLTDAATTLTSSVTQI